MLPPPCHYDIINLKATAKNPKKNSGERKKENHDGVLLVLYN